MSAAQMQMPESTPAVNLANLANLRIEVVPDRYRCVDVHAHGVVPGAGGYVPEHYSVFRIHEEDMGILIEALRAYKPGAYL